MSILGIPIATVDDLVKIVLAAFLAVCVFGLMIAIIGNIIDWFKGDDGENETNDKPKGGAA